MKKIIIIFMLFSIIAFSQWSKDPSENTRVTHGGLLPQMMSDGSGGAFIVYQDSPGLLRQVWVQRLDRFGYVQFPENGLRISTPDQYQTPFYCLVSDSAGGVIVFYEELHLVGDLIDEETYNAIYAQRMDSSGAKLWGDAGVRLSPFVSDKKKVVVSACSDGQHGAFVFWAENTNNNGKNELRAQRISANGRCAWDSSLVITNNFHLVNRSNPNPAVNDGNGNAIVLFSETMLQKLNIHGDFLWIDGVETYPVGRQMVSDNAGGVIIAGVRREFDGISTKYIVGAQRISTDGFEQWDKIGTVISEKADSQTQRVEIAIDKMGNSLVVWRDQRTSRFEEYAQKLSAVGIPMWQSEGISLSEYDSQKSLLGSGIVVNSDGSSVFIWHDLRIEDNGLFGQSLDSSGLKQWNVNDVPISTRDQYQRSHIFCSDNAGGAIACWYEIGTGSGWGIFAQQVSRIGNLGEVLQTTFLQTQRVLAPTQFLLQSYPNPFNSNMIIKYHIPETSYVSLTIYDLTGKEVKTLVSKNQSPGIYQVQWNGTNKRGDVCPCGIYLYQLCTGDVVANGKCVLVK